MNNLKRVILKAISIGVTGSMLTSTPTFAATGANNVAGVTAIVCDAAEKEEDDGQAAAGISNISEATENARSVLAQKEKTEEEKSASAELATQIAAEAEEENTSSPYDNVAIAQVKSKVNVRSSADEDGEIVGKIYNNAAATIEETLDGQDGTWYKIKSGNVEGYTKADYFVTGEEAEELAYANGDVKATVKAESLRLRSEASTDSEVVTLLNEDEKYDVVSKEGDFAELAVDGDVTGYVSSDYVDITVDFDQALTIEEEQAAIEAEERAEAERKAAEEEAARQAEKKSDEGSSSDDEDKSSDDEDDSSDDEGNSSDEDSSSDDEGNSSDEDSSSDDEDDSSDDEDSSSDDEDDSSDDEDDSSDDEDSSSDDEDDSSDDEDDSSDDEDSSSDDEDDSSDDEDDSSDDEDDSSDDEDEDSEKLEASNDSDGGDDTPQDSDDEDNDDSYSSVRDDIVSYALSFVGEVPYVYGGCSLSSGVDCSGFVQAVFKHFGYSLPRSSDSQGSAGYSVSSGSKQPGDIVYYGGHVAIYIGGGEVVHASNEKSGIKVSSWNYRSVASIRNVID